MFCKNGGENIRISVKVREMVEKVRLIFIAEVDPSGRSGQNIATKEVISALSRRKEIELTVICPKPRGENRIELKDIDQFKFLPEKKSRSILWHLKTQWFTYRAFTAIIKNQRPDGIVARFGPSLFIPPLIARVSNIPYILLLRGRIKDTDGEVRILISRYLYKIIGMKLHSKSAVSIYAAYKEIVDDLKKIKNCKELKINLFPNAINPQLFRPETINIARKRLNLNLEERDFVIGFVGSLKKRHGLFALLDAFQRISKENPGAKLLLVGEGSLFDVLQNQIINAGLEEKIVLTGFVPHHDVYLYISSCDVLYGVVHPDCPSNPIKCYEYLACSRPIITTDREEFKFVEEENAGILLPGLNVDDIEDVLNAFIKMTRNDRINMGRNGSEYVLKFHTWDRLVDNILEDLSNL